MYKYLNFEDIIQYKLHLKTLFNYNIFLKILISLEVHFTFKLVALYVELLFKPGTHLAANCCQFLNL